MLTRSFQSDRRGGVLVLVFLALGLIALVFHEFQGHKHPADAHVSASPSQQAGPPWRYGSPTARFTIEVFADLECPFCKAYTPVLRQWIDAHPDVSMQWHHLPLAMHQPAATQHAIWVECVGGALGQAGFWNAVSWVYAHTRSDGEGLPPGTAYPAQGNPEQRQAVRACLDSPKAAAWVSAQAQEAIRAGVDATPSLRVIDHASGRSMLLTGPVIGDALLSALDLLSAPAAAPGLVTDQ